MAKRIAGVDEKIIASAKAEFLQQGYLGASLREIARKADTSTTSIYTRYSNKEGLFTAVVEPTASEFIECVKKAFDISEDIEIWRESYQYNFWTGQIDFICKHTEVFSLLLTGSYHTRYAGYKNTVAFVVAKATYCRHAEKFAQNEVGFDFVTAICSGLFTGIFEIICHNSTKENTEKHILQLCHYFSAGWQSVLL